MKRIADNIIKIKILLIFPSEVYKRSNKFV